MKNKILVLLFLQLTGLAAAFANNTPPIRNIQNMNNMKKMQPLACPNTGIALSGTLTGIYAPNLQYDIAANITVSGTAQFTDSEIKITAGRRITVPNGTTLIIQHTHLYGCTQLWEGIYVEAGGNLLINGSSMVEDAYTAVRLVASAGNNLAPAFTADNVIFNKNRYGISLSSYIPTVNSYPFRIQNCVFTCRNIPPLVAGTTTAQVKAANNAIATPYESPYISNMTYPLTSLLPWISGNSAGIKPQTAITLDHVGTTTNVIMTNPTMPTYGEFIIGNGIASDYNVIDNYSMGINAMHSNFVCYNTVFQNPALADVSQATFGIYALVLKQGLFSCRVEPFPLGNNAFVLGTHNRFYNCKRSIVTRNYANVNVSRTCFRSTQRNTQPIASSPGEFGYWAGSNRFKAHVIQADSFFNIASPVTFYSTQSNIPIVPGGPLNYGGTVAVQDNIIQPNLPSYSLPSAYISDAIRVENLINVGAPGAFGHSLKISNNIINETYYGITCHNWHEKDVFVTENRVLLRQQPTPAIFTPDQRGISFINNPGVLPPSSLLDLVAANHITGFGYAPTGSVVFSTGIHIQNNFQYSVHCNTTQNTERGITFNADNSEGRFWDNTMTNHRYGYVLDNNGVGGWAFPSAASNILTDNIWTGGNNGAWNLPRRMSFLNNSVSLNSPLWVRNTPTHEYNPDNFSFSFPNPASLYSVAGLSVIYQTASFRSCSPPYNVNKTSHIDSTWIQVASSTFPYYGNTVAAQFHYENTLFQLLTANPDWRDSSAILDNFYWANINTNYGQLATICTAIDSGEWVTAQNLIHSFTPNSYIETANQRLYDIYVNLQIDSVLTAQDSTDLYDLASRCTEDVGMVVYMARSIYNNHYETSAIFGYICDSVGTNNRFAHTTTKKQEIYTLIPNPTQGNFRLRTEVKDILQLQIQDITGKILLKKEGKAQEMDFNTTLSAGIYFIHIHNTVSHATDTQKLIIE